MLERPGYDELAGWHLGTVYLIGLVFLLFCFSSLSAEVSPAVWLPKFILAALIKLVMLLWISKEPGTYKPGWTVSVAYQACSKPPSYFWQSPQNGTTFVNLLSDKHQLCTWADLWNISEYVNWLHDSNHYLHIATPLFLPVSEFNLLHTDVQCLQTCFLVIQSNVMCDSNKGMDKVNHIGHSHIVSTKSVGKVQVDWLHHMFSLMLHVIERLY